MGWRVADREPITGSLPGAAWPGRVERTSVADGVYLSLRDAVVDGRLGPATRLGEQGLAAQFRVSRTPVRQALRRLEQRRLVSALPTGGYQVTAWGPSDVRALYRVRAVLECLVAGEAAVRATSVEVAGLTRAAERAGAPALGDASAAGARGFHRAVARVAGIQLATDLLEDIADHEDRYRRQTAADADRQIRARDEHHHIVAEIRAGDRNGAEQATTAHLEAAAAFALAVLAGDAGRSPAPGGRDA